MENKIIKHFMYNGLGFPIELHNVTMIKINDEWHPKIDVRKISEEAIKALVTQENRLTGNQIKFIRSYFAMSLREFAENVVHESHTAVSKWEKNGNGFTNMDINIEKVIRLYVYDKSFVKTNKQRIDFYTLYQRLSQLTLLPKQMGVLSLGHL